jgi:hypothetical protein
MEKIYVDYAGGHFEAWTYSDGDKVRFSMRTMAEIRAYAKRHHYQLILTEEAKLFGG